MLDHLRSACGVKHFLAATEVLNARSVRLLLRLGFRAATETQAGEHALSASERLFVLGHR